MKKMNPFIKKQLTTIKDYVCQFIMTAQALSLKVLKKLSTKAAGKPLPKPLPEAAAQQEPSTSGKTAKSKTKESNLEKR